MDTFRYAHVDNDGYFFANRDESFDNSVIVGRCSSEYGSISEYTQHSLCFPRSTDELISAVMTEVDAVTSLIVRQYFYSNDDSGEQRFIINNTTTMDRDKTIYSTILGRHICSDLADQLENKGIEL